MNYVSHHVLTYILLAVVLAGWIVLAYRLDVRRRNSRIDYEYELTHWNRVSSNPLYRYPLRQIEAAPVIAPIIDGECERHEQPYEDDYKNDYENDYEGIGAKALTASDAAWFAELARLVRDDAPEPDERVMASEPIGPPTENEYYAAYYDGAFAELDAYLTTFLDRRLSVLLDAGTHTAIQYEQNAIEREWDDFTVELNAIVEAGHLAEALLVS